MTLLGAGAACAQGADAINGTWKLNLAKSTYSPGTASGTDVQGRTINNVAVYDR